jgi:hypothetical protein|tara:strand:+ start:992 stop:1216 length:225 start_codon:yes stop_codon:yes gene_type:complete
MSKFKEFMNKPISGAGHYTGAAMAVGAGIATGSAGMAIAGYAAGQIIGRAGAGFADASKREAHNTLNESQFGKK